LKGAAAGFGVITNFVLRTQPEPKEMAQFTFNLAWGDAKQLAKVFKQWQDLIADPKLDRRFGSQLIMTELGFIIEGTFFGSAAELKASGIMDKLPGNTGNSIVVKDWLGALGHLAETEALHISSLSSPFYSKSLGFRQEDLLSESGIQSMMDFIKKSDRGTLVWAVIFDLEGGAINDVAMNATAYAHRDKTMYYQSYAVGIPQVSSTTRNFLTGLHENIKNSVGQNKPWTTYAGYVDPALGPNAQPMYWGSNYPTLQKIKSKWDPRDVFHNLQSVRPA
jgi:hypothetical protein